MQMLLLLLLAVFVCVVEIARRNTDLGGTISVDRRTQKSLDLYRNVYNMILMLLLTV